MNDDFAYLMVRREQVEPNDGIPEGLNEDQFFSGSQNPFVLTRYLLQTFPPQSKILFSFHINFGGEWKSQGPMDYS
jgi:hypothetical protein